MKAIVCPQCGGLIDKVSDGEQIAECSYCGARILLEEAAQPAKTEPAVSNPFHVPLEDYKPFDDYEPYSVTEPPLVEELLASGNQTGFRVMGIAAAVAIGVFAFVFIGIFAAKNKPGSKIVSTPGPYRPGTPAAVPTGAPEVTNRDALILPPAGLPRGVRVSEKTQIVVFISVDDGGNVYLAEAYDGPEALRNVAVKAAKKAKFQTRTDGRFSSGTLVYDFGPK